ncbi:lipid-A-disaccharide synthase, partial [Campylobacter jejuni]
FSAMGFIEVLPLIFKSKKDIILTCKYKGKVWIIKKHFI